ncbi:MAG: hypothetical protein HUJ69_04110 [Lachnospiraceae bacterium]|nr:hypothetical protein [Lachnospiraceae bacterium]
MIEIFDSRQHFYKGNLHTHTTDSDGRMSPEDCIEAYRQQGYEFLALTDHRKLGRAYEDEGILVIPSAEYDRNYLDKGGPERAYHITGIGLKENILQDNAAGPQWLVNEIKKQGAFCTLAHPIWSLMTFEECMALQGYDAIEIYNGVSEVYSGRGYSDIYLDMLASRGIYKKITAVDDTHFYDRDVFKGYVMVQAPERTWEALYRSLMEEKFYASQGPVITRLAYDEEKVLVETRDAAVIRFMSNTLYDGHRTVYSEAGELLSEAEYPWGKADRFVRVEVEDRQGRKAWSNYIRRP